MNHTLNTSMAKLSLLLLAKGIFFLQSGSFFWLLLFSLKEDQNFSQYSEESTASSDLSAKPEDIQYTIEFTMDDQAEGEPDGSSSHRKIAGCKMQIELMGKSCFCC